MPQEKPSYSPLQLTTVERKERPEVTMQRNYICFLRIVADTLANKFGEGGDLSLPIARFWPAIKKKAIENFQLTEAVLEELEENIESQSIGTFHMRLSQQIERTRFRLICLLSPEERENLAQKLADQTFFDSAGNKAHYTGAFGTKELTTMRTILLPKILSLNELDTIKLFLDTYFAGNERNRIEMFNKSHIPWDFYMAMVVTIYRHNQNTPEIKLVLAQFLQYLWWLSQCYLEEKIYFNKLTGPSEDSGMSEGGEGSISGLWNLSWSGIPTGGSFAGLDGAGNNENDENKLAFSRFLAEDPAQLYKEIDAAFRRNTDQEVVAVSAQALEEMAQATGLGFLGGGGKKS